MNPACPTSNPVYPPRTIATPGVAEDSENGPRGAAGCRNRREDFDMYARSITFLAGPGTIDEGIAFVNDEAMPAVTAMDGCIGVSMICDRESGCCIITSAWSSEDAMTSSEPKLQLMRDRGAKIFGAEPSIDRWEITVVHRHAMSGEGACVRCSWFSMDPAGLSDAVGTYRMAVLPALEEMDGFCSASLMVDRATGHAVSSVTFASRDDLVTSRPAAEALRTRIADELGATVTDIREFELALAHLHVPEMA